MSQPAGEGGPQSRRPFSDLLGSYFLSYIIAGVLLFSLIRTAGIWNVLANTRLLDLLISSGVIRYHDVHLGLVDGLPDAKLFLYATDPIDWRLAGIVVAMYFLFWGVRALKFHGIARVMGMQGSLGEHGRAFLYGSGLNILFPFKVGNGAAALSTEGHGCSRETAYTVTFTQELFILFEITVFGLLGLALNGWTTWLGEIFWALVILLVAYLMLKPTLASGVFLPGQASWESTKGILGRLFQSPRTLAALCGLSLFAFLIDDFTPYFISQAFTTDFVILNVPFPVIQMGVVAGYIARQVAITPGGIGQFEWGFAMALYMGGVGMPEAATIAILESVVRHGTGLILFGIVIFWKGAKTTARSAFDLSLTNPTLQTGEGR